MHLKHTVIDSNWVNNRAGMFQSRHCEVPPGFKLESCHDDAHVRFADFSGPGLGSLGTLNYYRNYVATWIIFCGDPDSPDFGGRPKIGLLTLYGTYKFLNFIIVVVDFDAPNKIELELHQNLEYLL